MAGLDGFEEGTFTHDGKERTVFRRGTGPAVIVITEVPGITPAVARTAMFDQMTQAHIDYMLGKIPMGRFVEVAEVAAMVAWLASEDCSFSTGAVFDLTGGRATY